MVNLCSRGHDKDVVGTTSQNRCVVCRRISRGSGYSLRYEKLPAAPLLMMRPRWTATGGSPGTERTDRSSMMGGINAVLSQPLQRAFYRAQQTGYVTVGMADEICCALGYHPAEIYGDSWWRE